MVFFKAALNWSSSSNSEKFANPAHSMGFEPSQRRKAKTTANTMGTSVKMANPMKLGAIKL